MTLKNNDDFHDTFTQTLAPEHDGIVYQKHYTDPSLMKSFLPYCGQVTKFHYRNLKNKPNEKMVSSSKTNRPELTELLLYPGIFLLERSTWGWSTQDGLSNSDWFQNITGEDELKCTM